MNYWVTWMETNLVGKHFEADSAEAALEAARAHADDGGSGEYVMWVSDADFWTEESP